MKTEDDFETPEEYETYLEEQHAKWEAQEPAREKLQEMIISAQQRLTEFEDSVEGELIAFAEEHGLSFQFDRHGMTREFISEPALEIGLNTDGELFRDGNHNMYEYADPDVGWNTWMSSSC